jgi:hypothetical protein
MTNITSMESIKKRIVNETPLTASGKFLPENVPEDLAIALQAMDCMNKIVKLMRTPITMGDWQADRMAEIYKLAKQYQRGELPELLSDEQ